MNIPSAPFFRAEDFPDSDPRLLEAISRTMGQAFDALRAVPTFGLVRDTPFTSEASGATVVMVRNPLASRPAHVTVNVRRDDLSALTAVWSFEWQMANDQLRLSFMGLPASTKMRLSLEAR